MVRVNIISPKKLTDQHLVAEYLEIMMLVSYVRKHPNLEDIPKEYCLGKGHIKFFKNKLGYLKKRHEMLKKEMKKRGFKAEKTLDISGLNKNAKNWRPKEKEKEIIKKRLVEKISMKPKYYNYYGEKKSLKFYKDLLK